MKRLLVKSCLALLCASAVVFAQDPPAGRRAKYNFNSGWKLFVGDPKGAESPYKAGARGTLSIIEVEIYETVAGGGIR